MPDVRRARPDQRDRALRTVTAAFATDQVLRWVWPSDERYDACGPAFFGLLLDLRTEAGEVWVADGGDAIAMWDPPGGLYLATPDERWAGIQAGFTAVERDRWRAFDAALSVPAGAAPYWYLGVLATAPERQRSGLGTAVLRPILGAADRTGLPVYLETAGEGNVRFYARLDFVVERSARMPDGPTCSLMRRDPRPAREEDR